ncbi:intercellular adhesin biosynthesis polysaccharide N-deacetylase [Mammaliicoccus sp. Dog046]|uniref:intercellular adhesin biosynthesis polysaccharide N-deacetylase n=1 Tax=Mammaliicoccus sp. Dog046 TaxID=3034233 RepID=UPI002B25C101|nr:intercellular adhesin biosynthesis polysaccharide N-deacetylase [Mammaliicoccus sp. Dog046]WQK85639.1 intercellular adhesin biosynthesis polysaccharide N-deacetylase [Mammaliicoccus sp. Dog046]
MRRLNMKRFVLIFTVLALLHSGDEVAFAKKKTLGGEHNGCVALNYHRIREDNWVDRLLAAFSSSKELKIYSVTDTQFESHIKWLKDQGANFITLDELIKYKEKKDFPDKCVWVNFDDMDESIYQNAFPIIKKYNVPATGFVITGEVGAKDFHNINLSPKSELKEMYDSGLWEFASHTDRVHTMKKTTSMLIKRAEKGDVSSDIENSVKYIDQNLDGNVEALAYPYGQVNDKVVDQLKKETSIKYGFTLEEKAITPKDNNYYIPRVMVSDNAFNRLVKNWKGFNHG